MGFKECSASNCGTIQKYLTKGFCGKHYWQFRVHGKIFVTYKDKRPALIEGEIAKIPLGVNANNGYTIVDKEFAWLDKYSWCLRSGYAATTIDTKLVFIHSLILKPRKGLISEHKDMDGLNNRLSNLREATFTQNNANRNRYSNNKSGFKGVEYIKSSGKYKARLRINGRGLHLGCFNSAIEAARAYDQKAIELFGQFARLNCG